jgi:FkbM family methyltransferase
MHYHGHMASSMKQELLRFVGRQQWLRGRDRLLRAFSHPDYQKSHYFETDFFGHTYSGNLTNWIDWNVFYYGAFAIQELRLLAAIADALRAQGKPVNFYDIGANIGHHTLYVSSHADRVFAFEPFSVVKDEMVRKLKHANVGNVTVFPVALGDRTETGTYHPPTGANQGTGTLGEDLPDNAYSETIPVSVVRGDEFFASNHLPPISLLKMDVEGYESKVLEGLRETIWRDRPPILMEILPEIEATSDSRKVETIRSLLYPDHILFNVGHSRGQYTLKPYSTKNSQEALILPAELAGIIPGSWIYEK